MPSKKDALQKYLKKVRAAEADYEEAVKELYPVGASAAYQHGEHRIPCEIVHHGYCARVQVRGPGGKPHWVHASRLC